MLVSRCDGSIFIFEEFAEVLDTIRELQALERISKEKKILSKASRSPPKTPQVVKREVVQDICIDGSELSEVVQQLKLFQLHKVLKLRSSGVDLMMCCSISDAGT
jgi:hypothetical protein